MDESTWMREALGLARRGPIVDPNPRVGCVLISPQGNVVGRGYHAGAGTPHAEVMALHEAGPAAGGATAYVTLEPCHHTGRTGPCSQALLAAGVTRVVFAAADPNPDACGGADCLRQHGVDVRGGLLMDEARALNGAWEFAVTHRRPRVIWKYAATLDGYSAAADGTSQWITSEEARADVHRRRASCGAIVVGSATALADNPHLTVRDAAGTVCGPQPLRVVVGERDLPRDLRMFDQAAPSLHLRDRNPAIVLRQLHQRGIRQVWLEGGPTMAAAWFTAGYIDEVLAYLAPAFLGAGRPAIANLGISSIADIADLKICDVALIGPDLRITAWPIRKEK